MPTVKRYRPTKRATLLVGKRTLKRRQNNKVPRSAAYEKLKNNNIALAQALSKEKQESQFLYSQTIKLTGQLQDMQCSVNRRNDALSGILKSSTEALKLLVEVTDFVTTNIVSCQQIVGCHPTNPMNQVRTHLNTNSRRESTRRLSGKSPARGVVQPMVSGHTITKPVINLSRINMQRIAASPNMSDIEEATEINTSTTESLTPVRIADRQNRLTNRRIDNVRLPERIRLSSPRVSDENEQRSNIRSRRINDKKRKSKNIKINSETDDTRNVGGFDLIKSPRVALQDVSRLLQNSQSLNVRALIENDDTNDSTQLTTITDETDLETRSQKKRDEVKSLGNSSSKDTNSETERTTRVEEDPLEGPSWLLDASQNLFPSEQDDDIETSDSSPTSTSDLSRIQTQEVAINISRLPENKFSLPARQTNSLNLSNGDDQLIDLQQDQLAAFENVDSAEESRNVNLNRFNTVNQRRGRTLYDDDDFTMIINRRPRVTRNVPFDVSELDLPVLENPLIDTGAIAEPEPEITKTIKQIVPLKFRPSLPTAHMLEDSMIDCNVSMTLPDVHAPIAGNESDDGSEIINNRFIARKRAMKLTIESSSDSDCSPPLKKVTSKTKRKNTKRKDPSSAKVVLEKLADSKTQRQRSSSPDPRRSSYNLSRSMSINLRPEPASDSDSSVASTNSMTSSRPRRQKAPVNLKEPNLSKKLRRG